MGGLAAMGDVDGQIRAEPAEPEVLAAAEVRGEPLVRRGSFEEPGGRVPSGLRTERSCTGWRPLIYTPENTA
ncbi:hypothetical protein GCM10023083_21360 [Streptomyces phyllanthi]